MHGNNLKNKELDILFCQVERVPVTQSYQSLMMINISQSSEEVPRAKQALQKLHKNSKCTLGFLTVFDFSFSFN